MDRSEKLSELENRLDELYRQQQVFSNEIAALRREIYLLKYDEVFKEEKTACPPSMKKETKAMPEDPKITISSPQLGMGLERFIGENIASRLGIIVLVLGVAFGIKYAIDHSMLGPGLRVVLGYLLGAGLYVTSRFLGKKYPSFSAVLVSGALAIMYLITYGAYDSYHFISRYTALILMVVFTVVCVYEAIRYNIILIAHFGLLGAYAVPFLLSTGDENVVALFSYMAVINAGILVVSYFRKWPSLHWVSLFVSWGIFNTWYWLDATSQNELLQGLIFSSIWYVLFYAAFIAYQLHRRQAVELHQIALILINSFVAYMVGVHAVGEYYSGRNYSGLFTLCHALLHLFFAWLIYLNNREDKKLLIMVAGMFLACLTIVVPVQFDGNWVTLMWAAEAGVMLISARKSGYRQLESVSIFLLVIAALSHFNDLHSDFDSSPAGYGETLFLNISWFTTLFFFSVGTLSQWFSQFYSNPEATAARYTNAVFGILALFVLFLGSDQQLAKALVRETSSWGFTGYANHRTAYQAFWQWVFACGFLLLMQLISILWKRGRYLAILSLYVSLLFIPIAVFEGFRLISILDSGTGAWYAEWVRYFYILSLSGLVALSAVNLRKYFSINGTTQKTWEIFAALFAICILSLELIHYLKEAEAKNLYRFGLSILWGVSSAILIIGGILYQRKHLRVLALLIFALVFLKLFLFDSRGMDSLPKTILYLSLGMILLVVSFLYNRFKDSLGGDSKENK